MNSLYCKEREKINFDNKNFEDRFIEYKIKELNKNQKDNIKNKNNNEKDKEYKDYINELLNTAEIRERKNKKTKIKTKSKRIKLYIDIDDTIINTSENFIEKYSKEHGLKKSIDDLKDYKFKSIDRKMDLNEFLRYIESEEFFNTVKIDEEFLRFYKKNEEKYEWIFITRGTHKNLELKENFIREALRNNKKSEEENNKRIKYIGVKNEEKKGKYIEKNSIQIDDKYDELNTKAKYKILIKNYRETEYNHVKDIREDLYIMNEWKEIIKSIEWFEKEILGFVKI